MFEPDTMKFARAFKLEHSVAKIGSWRLVPEVIPKQSKPVLFNKVFCHNSLCLGLSSRIFLFLAQKKNSLLCRHNWFVHG